MKPVNKCNKCGTPILARSHEEKMKEFEENCAKPYGLSAEATMVSVCDDCYEECLEWLKGISPEQLKIWENEAKERGEF